MYKKIFIFCKISSGAFSGQREFEIKSKYGTHKGVAPRFYCFDSNKTQLPKDIPHDEEKIDGLIEGYIIKEEEDGDDMLFVSIPDGDVISVSKEIIRSF